MSMVERRRMTLMRRVSEGLLKVREAAEMMRVSYRQAKRIFQRCRQRDVAAAAGTHGTKHRHKPTSQQVVGHRSCRQVICHW